MSTPLDDMQARYDSEYQEQLQYAEARDWKWLGFESPEEMMETIEIFTEEENTIFESGWRAWYNEAMRTVREWYKAEWYQV
jgi:hypothetical protein